MTVNKITPLLRGPLVSASLHTAFHLVSHRVGYFGKVGQSFHGTKQLELWGFFSVNGVKTS